MSEKNNISWCDSTASPWFGCTEISAGCANCYARELTLKRKWAGWGDKSPRVRSKGFEAITNVIDQCQAAGVPVWVKQDCASQPGQQGRIPQAYWERKEIPKGI